MLTPREPGQLDPSRDGDTSIAELVDGLLRHAVDSVLNGDGARGSTVQDAIRDICAAAHQRGMLVERLVVLLNERWERASEVRQLRRVQHDSAEDARVWLVTRCIETYFTSPVDRT